MDRIKGIITPMDKNFKFTEENVNDAPVDKIEWEGRQDNTEQIPLMNDGTGAPIILRKFEFKLPPIPKDQFPTKQQLLDHHIPRLTAFLWKDELRPVKDQWKCIFSKDKKHFMICAVCQPKPGSALLENPRLLQEYANNKR